jgi:hypothetical protein
MNATLPPGWYTDPENSTQRRYWDGQAWTVLTGPAPSHNKSSEKPQSRIKRIADWFNTGTAAVKFAKASLSLLAFLGIITVGGAIVAPSPNPNPTPGPSPSPVPGPSPSPTSTDLSSALLQPCDLGACGDFGWSQTQFPASPSSGTSQSCPSYPKQEGVSTALTDGSTGIRLFEIVWRLTDPNQAISTFTGTAQNCTVTNSSGDQLTYQDDDNAGSYGSQSTVYTVGVTNPSFQDETPTIGAYDALIEQGNLLAWVYLTTGTEGVISQSMLTSIFTAAARRL